MYLVPFSCNVFMATFDVRGVFVRCRAEAQVSGMAETGYCFGQINLYLLMISWWILRLFQYKQELSSVYQFIDELCNLRW